jgi:hypothetical protein
VGKRAVAAVRAQDTKISEKIVISEPATAGLWKAGLSFTERQMAVYELDEFKKRTVGYVQKMADRNGRDVPDTAGPVQPMRPRNDERPVAAAQQNKGTYPERVHVWEDEQCWRDGRSLRLWLYF